MAEHAIPSPVLISYDPEWDTVSSPSDWEYYSDEYWDCGSPKKEKKACDQERPGSDSRILKRGARTKRRKPISTNGLPSISPLKLSSMPPTVVWRSSNNEQKSTDGNPLEDICGEEVTLLEDWRQQFNVKHKKNISQFQHDSELSRGRQQAVAVMIDNNSSGPCSHIIPSPSANTKPRGLPILSDYCQKASKPASPVSEHSPSDSSPPDSNNSQRENHPITHVKASTRRKRKAEDHSDEDLPDLIGQKRRAGQLKKATNLDHNDCSSFPMEDIRASLGERFLVRGSPDAVTTQQERELKGSDNDGNEGYRVFDGSKEAPAQQDPRTKLRNVM